MSEAILDHCQMIKRPYDYSHISAPGKTRKRLVQLSLAQIGDLQYHEQKKYICWSLDFGEVGWTVIAESGATVEDFPITGRRVYQMTLNDPFNLKNL